MIFKEYDLFIKPISIQEASDPYDSLMDTLSTSIAHLIKFRYFVLKNKKTNPNRWLSSISYAYSYYNRLTTNQKNKFTEDVTERLKRNVYLEVKIQLEKELTVEDFKECYKDYIKPQIWDLDVIVNERIVKSIIYYTCYITGKDYGNIQRVLGDNEREIIDYISYYETEWW